MLETITDLPKGIEGVKAVGEVSKEGYGLRSILSCYLDRRMI